MNSEINLYYPLAKEFARAGYNIDTDGKSLDFFPLNLIIEPRLINTNELENGSCSVIVNVCCKHFDKFPDGITEIAVGIGQSVNDAIATAFNNWIVGDFPPIHDYLCSSSNLLGDYSESISYSGELDKIIGWDLFFGPCMETSQNMNNLETNINKQNQKLIQQILFQPLVDMIFGTPGLYYIRIFMSKKSNGQIDCDCRVNGNDWEHGKNYLIDYIKKYQINSDLLWIKQNVLFVSKPAEEIQSSDLLEKLNDELSKQNQSSDIKNKKWWKFWN